MEALLSDSYDGALNEIWANTGAFANRCGEARKDIGELVGTAFVARDMLQIVDALDEDGLLRFWGMICFPATSINYGLLTGFGIGLSYGSALGATAAAMFPERMDRVILDGVVNSHYYNHGFGM